MSEYDRTWRSITDILVLLVFDGILLEYMICRTEQVVHQRLERVSSLISVDCPTKTRTDLERRLQIITIASREVLHRAGLMRSLNGLTRLFQMTDILQVRRLASPCVQSLADTSQDNNGMVLSSAMVSCVR